MSCKQHTKEASGISAGMGSSTLMSPLTINKIDANSPYYKTAIKTPLGTMFPTTEMPTQFEVNGNVFLIREYPSHTGFSLYGVNKEDGSVLYSDALLDANTLEEAEKLAMAKINEVALLKAINDMKERDNPYFKGMALSGKDLRDNYLALQDKWKQENDIDANNTWDVPNKVELEFSEPVELKSGYNKISRVARGESTNHKLQLFVSNNGALCYYISKSRGYPVSDLPNNKLVGMRLITGGTKQENDAVKREAKRKKADNLINKVRHPNLWKDLPEEFKAKPDDIFPDSNLRTANMKTVFGERVVKELTNAIEKGEPYHYSLPGTKRDRSVSVVKGEDGNLKAYYSSEYAGCGNGDYYLLLNPNTAVFCETD